jgi:peptidoglycan/LPS O-acetylase OafA/YrhL
MKGHKFLKSTGILMIVAAAFSIIAGVFVGGLGVLAAGLGAASGLTFAYWAALFLTLVGGICQLIAGIKGVRHSKRSEKAGKLIAWGVIVAVFSILSMVMNLVNGGEFNGVNLLTGVAVPALYIYGAVLNSKADDAQPAA